MDISNTLIYWTFQTNSLVGYPGLTAFTPLPIPSLTQLVDPPPPLPVLFSEIRTNNSELRMGLNCITDKVDKLIDKVSKHFF